MEDRAFVPFVVVAGRRPNIAARRRAEKAELVSSHLGEEEKKLLTALRRAAFAPLEGNQNPQHYSLIGMDPRLENLDLQRPKF